jgi:HSP20 family molecular chaperone IbpA
MRQDLKKAVIPFLSAIAGGLLVIVALLTRPTLREKLIGADVARQPPQVVFDDVFKKQNDIHNQLDNLLDDDFFSQKDPFEELRKMRRQMEKRMDRLGGRGHSMSNPFDSWFSDKFGGGTANDISKREDDYFVYYDIKVEDVKSTSITAKVENGYVMIQGSLERKNQTHEEGVAGESLVKSSFNRSFPVPENVNSKQMMMETAQNTIILKFPKVKS